MCRQRLDEVKHGFLAFAETHVVEAWRGKHNFGCKRGVQTAGDDGHVESQANGLDQVACAQPLARSE